MMRKTLLIAALVLASSGLFLNGQDHSGDITATLEKLFMGLRTNLTTEIKTEKNDSVRAIIDLYATSDSVFTHRFSNLRFLGQVTSPDSLVKLITWNLILPDGGNRYFCYIIRREKKTGGGQVYTLTGTYNENSVRTDTIYSSSGWYGALYYDLRPFIIDGNVKYALLGIDYGNSFITRKIIDVLSFSTVDSVTFGYKCFSDGKTIAPRVVFEYASTAVMSLKFEADGMIVFDHLSPVSPEFKGNRQFYGPDFSFDSFIFEKDLWRLKADIDIKNK
jgi:hypothetical protein